MGYFRPRSARRSARTSNASSALTVVIDPESNLAQRAGGTGPFKLDSLNPGDQMHLIRWFDYNLRDRDVVAALREEEFADAYKDGIRSPRASANAIRRTGLT